MKGISRVVRRRLGPVGMSLAAAAITAGGFAAFSLAADDGRRSVSTEDAAVPAPPPGPEIAVFRDRLSAEDREQMEEFRQCMGDNGGPAPPGPRFHTEPGDGDSPRFDPPRPPSSEEIDKIKEAFEACKSKLPAELQGRGFPPHPPCGPPRAEDGPDDREGEGRNEQQGYVVPAPAPSTASS